MFSRVGRWWYIVADISIYNIKCFIYFTESTFCYSCLYHLATPLQINGRGGRIRTYEWEFPMLIYAVMIPNLTGLLLCYGHYRYATKPEGLGGIRTHITMV